MIVVLGCLKGGVGKSTLCTNLTVLRAAAGKKVLLVDADEQKTTTTWAHIRDLHGIETNWTTIQLTGSLLRKQIEKMIPDYDDIFIDVGARHTPALRSSMSICDILIIPYKPRSFDIWTFNDMKSIVSEMKISNPKLQTYAVINQADSKGGSNKESLESLSEWEDIKPLEFTIGMRKAFAHAASEGRGVSELKGGDKKAIQEIKQLYDYIYVT